MNEKSAAAENPKVITDWDRIHSALTHYMIAHPVDAFRIHYYVETWDYPTRPADYPADMPFGVHEVPKEGGGVAWMVFALERVKVLTPETEEALDASLQRLDEMKGLLRWIKGERS